MIDTDQIPLLSEMAMCHQQSLSGKSPPHTSIIVHHGTVCSGNEGAART
jgi:hypothetical protein